MTPRVPSFRQGLLLILAAGWIAGAGGCAGLPGETPVADVGDERLWALHQIQVAAVSSWRLEGKVSVRRDNRLWGVGLNWTHDKDGDDMNLLGPGGRMVARLQNRPHGASAVDNKGRRYQAETFEELAAAVLGVEVPVSSLRYWVAGVPDPGAAIEFMRVDQNGRMEALEQGGWRVRYLDYQTAEVASSHPLALPSLLALTRGGLKVTVAANRWRLLKVNHVVERAI